MLRKIGNERLRPPGRLQKAKTPAAMLAVRGQGAILPNSDCTREVDDCQGKNLILKGVSPGRVLRGHEVPLTVLVATYRVPMYDRRRHKTGNSGTGDSQRAGGRLLARLRNRTQDRTADARQAALHSGVALSASLSHGEQRLGARSVGSQRKWPPPALLPANPRRKEKTRATTPGMVRAIPCAAAACEGGRCLIGRRRFESNSRARRRGIRSRKRLRWSPNSPITWRKRLNHFAGKECPSRKLLAVR